MDKPLAPINAALVSKLITTQFPKWAHLPIDAVKEGGHDHRSFRLGNNLLVRIPSQAIYAPQVIKEQTWLPYLARHINMPTPKPVALGSPSTQFPWH